MSDAAVPAGDGAPAAAPDTRTRDAAEQACALECSADDGVELVGLVGAPFSLHVLHVAKTAQHENGLRHGNYQRYQKYCTRRVHRLRKALGMTRTVSKKKAKAKAAAASAVDELGVDLARPVTRQLLLWLFQAERCWAHAMLIKEGMEEEDMRPRHHMVRRLKKAVKWADALHTCCERASYVEDGTALEAEAYALWMRATLAMEREEWETATERFARSRKIYAELRKVCAFAEQEAFQQRVDEIELSLRFCRFSSGAADEQPHELRELATQHAADAALYDPLSERLSKVLADTRKRKVDGVEEVKWRRRTVGLKSDKVRVAFLGVQDATFEVEREEAREERLQLYTKLFMCLSDASEVLRAEMRPLEAMEKRSNKDEALLSDLRFLSDYLSFLKLSRTIERNLLLVDSARNNLRGRTARKGEKPSKPDDLVRLFEIMVDNLAAMRELFESEDVEELKRIAAQSLSFKAQRCFYVAVSYSQSAKLAESAALLDLCSKHIETARAHHVDRGSGADSDVRDLDALARGVRAEQSILRAEAAGTPQAAEQGDAQSLSVDALPLVLASSAAYTSAYAEQRNFAAVPPEFRPAPCKPILFDLALLSCKFPSLEAKKSSKKGGGFWSFWRS